MGVTVGRFLGSSDGKPLSSVDGPELGSRRDFSFGPLVGDCSGALDGVAKGTRRGVVDVISIGITVDLVLGAPDGPRLGPFVGAGVKTSIAVPMDGKLVCAVTTVAGLGNCDLTLLSSGEAVGASVGTERSKKAPGTGATVVDGPPITVVLSNGTMSGSAVGERSLLCRAVGGGVSGADSKRMPFTLGLAMGSEPNTGLLDVASLATNTGKIDLFSTRCSVAVLGGWMVWKPVRGSVVGAGL
jgi:hypothetical protein